MTIFRSATVRTRYAALLSAGLALAAAPAAHAQQADAAPAAQAPAAAPPAASPVADTAAGPAPAETGTQTAASPPADNGGIVVQGSVYAKQDPMHAANEKSYQAIQAGDKLIVAPVATAYRRTLPSPVRQGLHNVLYNLREPTNFAAAILEHKFGRAGQTLVRFTVNSTIGLAGIIDVARAKPLNIPYRPNGLADVAGFYGIKSGPYFYLPLVGPTTLRDVIGTIVDRTWFPLAVGGPLNSVAYTVGVTVVGGLDDRTAVDAQLRDFREKSADPYRASRNFYLKRRQAEIDALHTHNAPAPATPPTL